MRVSAFCPGVIRTEILNDGGVYGRFAGDLSGDLSEAELERARPMDVDAFAKAALARLARNPEIIILPGMWRVFDLLDRLFPSLVGRLAARRFFTETERRAQARRAAG